MFVVGLAGTAVEGGATGLPAADLNRITIRMGNGSDSVQILNTVSTQGKVVINGSAGNDTLSFAGETGGALKLNGGKGNDTVSFSGSAAGTAELIGAGQYDTITFAGNALARLSMVIGAGNDTFVVSGNADGDVSLKGGGGEDTVTLTNSTFAFQFHATMGGGVDTFVMAASVSLGTKTRFAFGSGDDILVVTAFPTIPTGGEVLF